MKNNKLGLTIFQWSWILVFVSLIIVYWQTGYNTAGAWHPTPEQKPDLLLPTIATVLILASGWFARTALNHIKGSNTPSFQSQWILSMVTGAIFFVIMVQQFFALPGSEAESQQYGQIYRVMIAYHFVHAIIILLMMVQVYRYSRMGRYHAENHWSVEATARLWYFVIVAWLMFYVVLYLI